MDASPLSNRPAPRPRWQALAAWLLLPLTLAGQAGLRVEVVEGAGAVVPAGMLSSRRFTVVVKDAQGQRIQGATVRFRLPAEGPSGTFSSGLRSETALTDAHGRATVYGIQWANLPGKVEMEVIAAHESQRGSAVIPVELSRRAAASREDRANPSFKAPSSGRKWLILALVGAGAAAGAGLAGKGGGKGAVYEPPAAVIVPPSIGTPTITVGKP